MPGVYLPGTPGDSDLEHRLCQVDRDLSSVHPDSSSTFGLRGRCSSGTLWCRRGGGVHPISTCAGSALRAERPAGPSASCERVAADTWLRRCPPRVQADVRTE